MKKFVQINSFDHVNNKRYATITWAEGDYQLPLLVVQGELEQPAAFLHRLQSILVLSYEDAVSELVQDRPGPKKEESKKEEPKKVEPKKEEPKKVEPKKVEPKKVEPKKVEPKKVEPKKVEPKKVKNRKLTAMLLGRDIEEENGDSEENGDKELHYKKGDKETQEHLLAIFKQEGCYADAMRNRPAISKFLAKDTLVPYATKKADGTYELASEFKDLLATFL